jgi:hypothetical protein
MSRQRRSGQGGPRFWKKKRGSLLQPMSFRPAPQFFSTKEASVLVNRAIQPGNRHLSVEDVLRIGEFAVMAKIEGPRQVWDSCLSREDVLWRVSIRN